jgi:hypothetical protein
MTTTATHWEDDPFWRCPDHDVTLTLANAGDLGDGQDHWVCPDGSCKFGKWV